MSKLNSGSEIDHEIAKESASSCVLAAPESAALVLLEEQRIIPRSSSVVKITTSKEIWAYYLFYGALSGLSPFLFAPSQFQNLLFQAGYDPDVAPIGQVACGAGNCVLQWAGSTKAITSIVLDINGISFAVQLVLFLVVGSFADYGSWRPYILITASVVGWAIGFAWLGVKNPSQWQGAGVLYGMGLVSYQMCLSYFQSAFAGLARDLPIMQQSEADVEARVKTPQEHARLDMMQRNKISNLSWLMQSCVQVPILVLAIAITHSLKPERSTQANNDTYSALLGYFTAWALVLSIPWFLFEQYRPGQLKPPGTSYLTVGFQQLLQGAKSVWYLKQTLLWLFAYFCLSDSLNTAGTVISTIQYQVLQYSTTELVYVYILGFGTEAIGIYLFWELQKRKTLSTKWMTFACACGILFMSLWGLPGIWTHKFGYKTKWEVWAFQAYTGLIVAPWYAYSATFITEVVPPPKMYLFFSLFACVGKTSSFVGPFVTSAIIDRSGNESTAFWFLISMAAVGLVALGFVNVDKSRIECRTFLEREKAALYDPKMEQAGQPV